MSSRNALSALAFTVIAVLIVALIGLVNWLPSMFQEHTLQRYASIDAMKTALHIKRVFVPAYFPQTIVWPPSEIVGQAKPFTATLMLFRSESDGENVLVITQATDEQFPREKFIAFSRITERAEHRLPGATALLEVGICNKDAPCSRLSWKDGAYYVTLTMQAPPFELLKIASSMTH